MLCVDFGYLRGEGLSFQLPCLFSVFSFSSSSEELSSNTSSFSEGSGTGVKSCWDAFRALVVSFMEGEVMLSVLDELVLVRRRRTGSNMSIPMEKNLPLSMLMVFWERVRVEMGSM